MEIITPIQAMRAVRRAEPELSWGFVPTLGALHEGHLSLVRRARAENDRVVASIFVNPMQFERQSDLQAYPRTVERDADLLNAEGVDVVWTPDEAEMYPPGFQTVVDVQAVTRRLEGEHRPGHLQGVTTIVTKLFNVVRPTRAYFGQKDAQQAAAVRRLVLDLSMDIAIVVCPTVREADGLAMSSRNVLLTQEQRAAAPVLYRALSEAVRAWEAGEHQAEILRSWMKTRIESEPLAQIDYISVADPDTLEELHGPVDRALLSLAVYFGDVRLIDNMTVS
ncbi:MAG: pantoate--beta-alanine ligase [Chloroflexi bacterium]|nr:pantoate--beta-alanine ligase [Chloroflexota bacterium]